MKNKFWLILILGLIIRLILIPMTYHSDIQTSDLAGYVIGKGNILSYYDFLPSLPKDDPIFKTYPVNLFNYPPAVYFFLGASSLLLTSWEDPLLHNNFLFNIQNVLGKTQIGLHLFLLKIPFLIFDLALAFLILRMFSSQKEKFLAFSLWLLNPISLYVSFMVGQFDVIPTFFVILSLYFVLKKPHKNPHLNLLFAAIFLGIGGCFKIYPLFLLIPLASFVEDWKKRIETVIVGFIPYFLMILPFLPSQGFRSTALLANQTLKSLYPQIPISGGESIMLFLAFLIFFYLLFLNKKISAQVLWQRFFIILLLFFIFTHYHPQWFLWITPFFIFVLVKSNFQQILAVLVSLVSFIGLLFFFDPGLTVGLFSPIFPHLYTSKSIWQILNISVDYNFLRSILQTIFVGSAFYFIYTYFPKGDHSL